MLVSTHMCGAFAMRQMYQIRHKTKASSKRWIQRQINDVHSKESKTQNYPSRAAFKLIEINDRFRVLNKGIRNIVDLGFAPGAWTKVVLEKMAHVGVKANILGVDLIRSSPPAGAHFIQGDIFSRSTHHKIRDHFCGAGTNEDTEAQSMADSSRGLLHSNVGNEHSASSTRDRLREMPHPDRSTTQDAIASQSGAGVSDGREGSPGEKSRHETPVDLILSDMMANTSGIKDADHFASMDLCDGCIVLACEVLKPKGNMVMKYYTGKEDRFMVRKLEAMFHKVKTFKPRASRNESKEMYAVGLKKRTTVGVADVFGPQT